jgi:arginyl-tRNA synthetase
VTPAELADLVISAVSAAVDAGELAVEPPSTVTLERPKNKEHGDYATNAALQLAKPAGKPSLEVAQILAARLADHAGIESVDVAGPGFLNITLSSAAQGELARLIVESGKTYGRTDTLAGRINVEFISANPPALHLGHRMGGRRRRDASPRAAGAEISREFISDRGAQMDKFGASLRAAAPGGRCQDGYHGAYIVDLARQIVGDKPEILDLPYEERSPRSAEGYLASSLSSRPCLTTSTHLTFGSPSGRSMQQRVAHSIEVLREKGHVYEQDGALWMRTTDFGDDGTGC